MKQVFTSDNAEKTALIADDFASTLNGNEVIAMLGDLGAGKTTFTRALCKALGSGDDITSPTFSLVNEYNGKFKIYHFDMYRITTFEDLEAIGFFDYIDNNCLIIIEWSENIIDFINPDIIIDIHHGKNENERIIIIDGRRSL